MKKYDLIPHFQIRHNAIVIYNVLHPRPPRRDTKIVDNRVKSYSGIFSAGAISRMKRAIDIMMQTNDTRLVFNPVTQKYFPFRFNFITLTVSDTRIRQARECYDLLLKPFLRAMRDKYRGVSYIWKLELQKRGQPHYHITTNKFIEYGFIKSKWNSLQRKAGMLENYAYRYGHYHPNSTDVHAVKNIRNWAAYMCKYMAKDVGGKVNGKIWDASKDLKRPRYSDLLDGHMMDIIFDNVAGHFEFEKCEFFLMDNPVACLRARESEMYAKWLRNESLDLKEAMQSSAREVISEPEHLFTQLEFDYK